MKSYTITVNGTAYEVTVEENGNAAAPVAAAPKAAAPAPKAAPAAAPKAAAPAAGAGSVKVSGSWKSCKNRCICWTERKSW